LAKIFILVEMTVWQTQPSFKESISQIVA